jgi:UPF0716 family protein affecting phage T7 exclusion
MKKRRAASWVFGLLAVIFGEGAALIGITWWAGARAALLYLLGSTLAGFGLYAATVTMTKRTARTRRAVSKTEQSAYVLVTTVALTLFIVPGGVSNLLGLICLMRPVRRAITRWVRPAAAELAKPVQPKQSRRRVPTKQRRGRVPKRRAATSDSDYVN